MLYLTLRKIAQNIYNKGKKIFWYLYVVFYSQKLIPRKARFIILSPESSGGIKSRLAFTVISIYLWVGGGMISHDALMTNGVRC